jgi:hypothetical protein
MGSGGASSPRASKSSRACRTLSECSVCSPEHRVGKELIGPPHRVSGTLIE